MAIEDIFEGGLGTGLAVGIGVAVLGPLLRPLVANVVRPAAKMAIRGGIYAYDRGREMAAQAREMADDAVVEARSEMAAEPATHRPAKRRPGHDVETQPAPG